jgi:heterodisulfide reductase subunit C
MTDKKFGFDLYQSRELDLNKTTELNAEMYSFCIQCGSCSASCIASLQHVNLRKAIALAQRGKYHEAAQQIANCSFCGKCMFVCARGLSTRYVIAEIRRLSLLEK